MVRVSERTTNSARFSCHLLEIEIMALLDRYSPGTNLKQRAKNKKAFDRSEMGNLRGEKKEVASLKVKKARSLVRLQL